MGEIEKDFPLVFLLYGHLDIVSPVQDWKSNPFKLKVVRDRVYGPGTHEMKGGDVTILLALKNFGPKNFKLKVTFG